MRATILSLALMMATPFGDDRGGPGDRFAGEPDRPRAAGPVEFGRDWDRARAEAGRTGRRILAVFTGERCGWCRVLERRTFADAEVVTLSREFVRVELDVGDPAVARLADAYGVDSIPRSFVLTPDGRVAARRVGYVPAAEYADWLRAAPADPPEIAVAAARPATPPPAVGATEAEADVTIWSVDSGRGVARWGDADWTRHALLLQVLRAAGLRPRVEHMARDAFSGRWDQAETAGRRPEIVMADALAGLLRQLERDGRLIDVASQRLAWAPEDSSCPDLAGRLAFLIPGSLHETAGRRAVAELLRPGPAVPLPGPALPATADPGGAAAVARRAAAAFLAGDAAGLAAVAVTDSPQLARCTRPHPWQVGREVAVGATEVRGNAAFAVARVEAEFRGPHAIGADPILVVLRREGPRWEAFAVSGDIASLRELPALCRLDLDANLGPTTPPAPRPTFPADGSPLGRADSFAWEVAGDGGPLAAQVVQVLLDEPGGAWPETRLKAYPGSPRGRALPRAETDRHVTGVTADRMSWCVWAIGRDGRVAASTVAAYLRPAPE